MAEYDLIIIGGGPAGYAAAFEAAASGLKTCIAEKAETGGTCLNRGCVPTKTLVHTADLYRDLCHGSDIGIIADHIEIDTEALLQKKEAVVSQLRDGLEKQIRAAKIGLIHEKAVITGSHTVRIGETEHTAENILVAGGSVPLVPPIDGSGLPGVITSDDILRDLPSYKELVIIGGGVIGCEIAGIYESLGTKITVIEALDTLLPSLDSECGRSLAMQFKKRGIDVHCKARVQKIEPAETGLCVTYTEKDTEKNITADAVLMAVGRKAVTDMFEIEPPQMERGRIIVDENCETSIKGIYAAGDAAAGYPQLAHAAMAMGVNAVCAMRRVPAKRDLLLIPSGVYVSPEIASAGMSEKEAAEKGIEACTAKANTMANARSLIASGDRGFIKVTAEKGTGRLLGAVMYCERATDLIQEAAAAIAAGMTVSQLLSLIHGHPTFSEIFVSALEAAEKKI